MKTSHYLVTAAGLAAVAVAVYTQVPGLTGAREVPKPAPTVPLAAEQPVVPFGQANTDLPPIVTPPDGNLVIPASAGLLPLPNGTEEPVIALPPVPAVPALPAVPAIPPVTTPKLPEPPALPPVSLPTETKPVKPATPTVPAVPVIPPPEDLVPVVPGVPAVPVIPAPPVVAPPTVPVPPIATAPVLPPAPLTPPVSVTPLAPTVPVAPPAPPKDRPLLPPVTDTPPIAPPPTAVLPKPAPLPVPAPTTNPPAGLPLLPPPSSDTPAVAKPNGKYVVVKTEKAGNKLMEGSVIVAGEKAIIRQGSFDRTVAKADLVYVAETKDEVYRHLLSTVPAKDVPARLGLARWLMFAGMREQALTESREVLKLQPTSIAASEMARSLEESIRQFPGDGSTLATKPAGKPTGGALVSTEPEPDVTAEGATSFVARAQPVLANQCMDCHARADYPGAFKLIRVNGFEIGPQSTNANLRATASQLKKEDPINSPLLTKALSQHGGMKQQAFVSRQAAGYRVLEAWVLQAVTPVVQPMPVPAQPVLPPVAVTPPMPVPVVPPPVLPPVEPVIPVIPPAAPSAAVRPAPVLPPAPPIDVPPLTIPVVPDVKVPPVLPTPPSIPPVDVLPRLPTPTVPVIPVIPPAASLPKPPGAVQPASGTGSGFGTEAPPKPPAPTGPTGGDEFDPAMFNKAGMGK